MAGAAGGAGEGVEVSERVGVLPHLYIHTKHCAVPHYKNPHKGGGGKGVGTGAAGPSPWSCAPPTRALPRRPGAPPEGAPH